MYTILYTILTPQNDIMWYCKTPMKKAKSLVFCKMAFRGIVLYQGFDFLSLRNQAWKIKCLQTKCPKKYPKTAFSGFFLPSSPSC